MVNLNLEGRRRRGKIYFDFIRIKTSGTSKETQGMLILALIQIYVPEKFQVSSTGFEPTTSAMSVKCSHSLRFEQVNLFASCVRIKGMMNKRNVSEVRRREMN